MALALETKKKVISEYSINKKDCGSAEVQVALLTTRINGLADHFKANAKDHHSRYGLIKMVGRRKRLLTFLRSTAPDRYRKLIDRLNLRK